MIDRMMVFGCSYMKGTELPQKYIPNIDDWAKIHFKRDLSADGSIPIRKRTSTDHLTYYDIERSDPHWERRCEELTCTYQTAEALGIKYYENYAVGGYSNTAIAAEVFKRLHTITDTTLVVVGITYPFRNTRLNDLWDTHTDHPKPQCSSTHKFVKHLTDYDPEKALEILRNVDDVPARYLQAQGIMSMLTSTVQNLLLIDSIAFYREVADIKDRAVFRDYDPHEDIAEICIPTGTVDENVRRDSDEDRQNHIPELTESMQNYFNETFMPYTLSHSIANVYDKSEYYRCVLTHPNWRVHEDFSKKYLTPYIKECYNV